jgi:SAM-dependent methyltransferase
VEIGGGMSGFQFVMCRNGCQVINVDPGQEEMRPRWGYNEENFNKLNSQFGTDVEMRSTTIDKAGLEDKSFDCAYSISVLEHLPLAAISTIMTHVWKCLKPGARFVLTVDLFLNLAPFTHRLHNEFGTNIDLKWLLCQAPFVLEEGNIDELFGFNEFNPAEVLARLETYLIATDYPVLSQCLVVRKVG